MTMTIDTLAPIASTLPLIVKPARESAAKRKAAPDLAARVARARQLIEKLEEQNHKAVTVLQDMTSLWLSADAKRRRTEAEMALNHFDAALTALRKSLAAQ